MNIGFTIFAYCRDRHLMAVLEGLKKNKGIDHLYIFQDGLKCEDDRPGWEATRTIIEEIDWCQKRTIYSEINKGLADSIVDGVNLVLSENDAIIVLEDDCVPHPSFATFMQQCLVKYQNCSEVHSVSGYSWPIHVHQDQSDLYFCGRISTWGWGTWKDRWKSYSADYLLLRKLKSDLETSKRLAVWGTDLERILIGNVTGKNNTWDVFWALNAIQYNGKCINPYRSLIQNIGFDGTGVHCVHSDKFHVQYMDGEMEQVRFPDKIQIYDETTYAFAKLYGSYTAVSGDDGEKERVLIFGLGNFYFQNEQKLNEKYEIVAFVDNRKKGLWAGKRIVKPIQISEFVYDKLIIMIDNIQICIDIIKMILDNKFAEYDKIILGNEMYGRFCDKFDFMKVMPDGKIQISTNHINVIVASVDEFNNAYEVLIKQNYCYAINNHKKDVVLDVGMNIGDAVLYFLNNPKTEKVYAFEPFRKTFESAEKNLGDWLENKDKLEAFNFGISDRNEFRSIGFNKDMSCGQSTIQQIRKKAYENYLRMGLVSQQNEDEEQIEVRSASEVFGSIIRSHLQNNIVLKLDCEGEEYNILADLVKNKLLDKIDFIMLEWHYGGKESILEYLDESGFSYWLTDKNQHMGMIYAYRSGSVIENIQDK